MRTIRPYKALVKLFFVIQDEGGNIVQEVHGPDAVLFHPLTEQLESLLYASMEKLQEEMAAAGTPVQMPGGKVQVSNGKQEEPSERPVLQLRQGLRGGSGPGGGADSA